MVIELKLISLEIYRLSSNMATYFLLVEIKPRAQFKCLV